MDINDLLDQYEDNLIDQALENLKYLEEPDMTNNYFSTNDFLNLVLNNFYSFGDDVYFLLGTNGDSKFYDKLCQNLIPILKKYFFNNHHIQYEDYLIALMLSAIKGTIMYWHYTDCNITEKELAKLLTNFLKSGIEGHKSL